jgi:hypothetical protein
VNDHDGSITADDCEVIPAGGGRFIVRVGRVRVEVSLDELLRLRQGLTSVADRFNLVLWKIAPPDVAH